ncbi:unnamed protein product [Mesocestoides corti]|uniref:GCF C-terminal domain-containing protein n=1 Tax=Mesocestoides corti TaxID=53468 RepID=A0A158QSN6_MESCO|nr:unnamed protein product [Mesocestoides corti]
MFRRPRRAYRGPRKDESDEESETTSPGPVPNPVNPPQLSGSKSTLSFGDDLEGTLRPAHSRRVLKQLKEGKSSLKSTTPEVDSTRKDPPPERVHTYPATLNESPHKDNMTNEDEIIKVKPLHRTSSEQFSSMLKQGVIPDANTIHMVRKQRQQAKFQLEAEEEGASPPHVAINDGRRLVREEDDDDAEEEDYEGGGNVYNRQRPAFTVTAEYRDPNSRRRVDISRGLQRRREREQREGNADIRSMIEAVENEEKKKLQDGELEAEEEEAEDAWEKQQIQKAVSNKNSAVLEALAPSPPPSSDGGLLPKPLRRATDFGDVTLASVKATLQARLDKKREAMLANKSELEAAQGDLARGRVAISDSRLKLPELANALAFYMEIREYVRDVICCLNEKMPKIEYMDRKSIILYRERADTLMSRRRADVGDMADEAAGVVENGDNPEAAKSAEARRRRKADREARRTRRRHQSKPDEVQSKRLEATIGVVPSYEGVSSDDEEPQAVIARRAADFARSGVRGITRDRKRGSGLETDSLVILIVADIGLKRMHKRDKSDIKNDAEHIFDDVVEEFCAIACILRRFAEWRERLARTYAQAYIPMCLPQLLAPLIRLQVLTWNPLEANCPSFDEYPWFGCLLDHYAGLRQTGGGAHEHAPAGDEAQKVLHSLGTSPDHELSVIPLAIERVLLPRLTEIVSASWDPMSWSQTQRLVTLLRTFAALWPTVSVDNKATQRLFEAALQRMEQTIQMDVFIPLYSKIVMSDPQSPGRLFFNRQLNVAMKLLSNLLQWHDLLAPAALKHLAFTCLVNRYILIGFASLMSTSVGEGPSELELWQEVASRLRAIVGQLPADWLTDPGDDKLAQLRRFVNQLIEKVAPEDTAVPTVETKEEMTMKPVLKKLKRIQNRLLAKPP